MSWQELVEIIAEEAGNEVAKRVEKRARILFGGMRITIKKKPVITLERIDQLAPGNPKKAAHILGVHHSTIYRVIKRQRIIR